MMKTYSLLCTILFAISPFCFSSISTNETGFIILENEFIRYVIGKDGRNLHFIDQRDGSEYCDPAADPAVARVRIEQKVHTVSTASFHENRIHFEFENCDAKVMIQPIANQHFLQFRVEQVSGSNIDEFTFLDLSLIRKEGQDPLVGCALALNLKTNVPELPQANTRLRAMCYPRFGMTGAEAAIIGCPQSKLRETMKIVVSQADEIPHSTIGGPWALDAEINQGSYLFNFGGLSEETADQWIWLAQDLGINQIDFHGGSSFRFGDCEPNPQTYPQGRTSFKAVIDRLHAAGIAAGLHTYAFFIDKKCPWVTPIPDPRLAKDAEFTLAADLTMDATTVAVSESTRDMSTITGFFVRNSVTLQIEDELVTYEGIHKEAPFAFTNCRRGAYGTTAAAHPAKSKVYHLKECFGLFVPDGDSSLLTEVAAANAAMFNECGFDMMYLDALDGEDILGGHENGWHYGSKFTFELVSRLHKSPLMEMSTFHHHLWYVRSRMGAWDHPTRGHKRFIDIHCKANEDLRRMFLPGHLGWWAIKTWTGTQGEPTFSDDIEYLCCKSMGNDAGISIMGINPDNRDKPVYQRLAKIIKNYETLRHANYFSETIKEKLRTPGEEFTLIHEENETWKFRPAIYLKHKIENLTDGGSSWQVENPYPTQPLKLRIEALTSAQAYESEESPPLVDFSKETIFTDYSSADGVRFEIKPSREQSINGWISGEITATNTKRDDPKSAWGHASMTFDPPLDLRQKQALGVWIYGDGKGEVLNFQMRSPEHLVGGIGERYVIVDFEGWRYFPLVEMESERYDLYRWPYGSPYAIYRENVNFQHIEKFSIWCNDIPLNQSIRCWFGPVKALPHGSTKTNHPFITIGEQTITFPIVLKTGEYLEFFSMSDCNHYSSEGELLATVKPVGAVPHFRHGANEIRFTCESPTEMHPRIRITIIGQGEPLSDL
ncbi:MAG: hypothetical protein C4527_06280 [Candidatus Omnitrophota bacterium]|jgi:hypothetical protein|nr:MAG: hypothetical protein C4527_06280 [Candidatus Omnitrophota bacterium]